MGCHFIRVCVCLLVFCCDVHVVACFVKFTLCLELEYSILIIIFIVITASHIIYYYIRVQVTVVIELGFAVFVRLFS